MSNAFQFIQEIILTTPFWAWLILIYLLFLGIKLTRSQMISVPKPMIIPLFIIMPLFFSGLNYVLCFPLTYSNLQLYFLTLIAGSTLGIWSVSHIPLKIVHDKERASFEIPGSYLPLIIFISFFAFKYIFGYGYATNPQFFNQYSFLEILISALFSGYFVGRLAYYLYQLKKA